MSDRIPTVKTMTLRKIFVPEADWLYTVQPDPNGFGCVEVSYCEDGIQRDSMTIPPDEAVAVAKAMLACAAELVAQQSSKSGDRRHDA